MFVILLLRKIGVMSVSQHPIRHGRARDYYPNTERGEAVPTLAFLEESLHPCHPRLYPHVTLAVVGSRDVRRRQGREIPWMFQGEGGGREG
jgi:hypothetical protein